MCVCVCGVSQLAVVILNYNCKGFSKFPSINTIMLLVFEVPVRAPSDLHLSSCLAESICCTSITEQKPVGLSRGGGGKGKNYLGSNKGN